VDTVEHLLASFRIEGADRRDVIDGLTDVDDQRVVDLLYSLLVNDAEDEFVRVEACKVIKFGFGWHLHYGSAPLGRKGVRRESNPCFLIHSQACSSRYTTDTMWADSAPNPIA
jgi:hypothetical protein